MTDVLLWKMPDGKIVLGVPLPETRGAQEPLNQWLDRLALAWRPHPQAVVLSSVPASTLPGNRAFRNCWRDDGLGKVQVDMPLARQLRLEEIRAKRDVLLAQTDTLLLRAVEAQDAPRQQALKALRQTLRDVPQSFPLDKFTTPEALAQAEPPWPVVA